MAGDASTIVQTAEYYWRYWERYRKVPSGCMRQNWKPPNLFVCAGRLSASRSEVREAFERLDREFHHVRVNSRQRGGEVLQHDDVNDRAAFWTLELSGGDGPEKVCLAIAIDNSAR